MYVHQVKVPKDRVAVIIGTEGAQKRELEEKTQTSISVDSHEGDISINGEDPLNLFITREMVKAIGRGFNPEVAEKLMKQDFCFELIQIRDFGDTKKDFLRLKGRVIGHKGKSREAIENMCEVDIVVYGKTVGIIGEAQHVPVARRAVESLLSGSPHSSVYKWLEKQRHQLKKLDLIGDHLVKEQLKEDDDVSEDADE